MKNPRKPAPRRSTYSMPTADRTLILEAEKMTAGGRCLARCEGKVFFIEGAIPGERVAAAVTFENKNYGEASAVSLETPSPSRITPPCPLHFGIAETSDDASASSRIFCGGCDWQHIEYSRQLELKKQIVADALERTAKIHLAPEDCVIEPSSATFRYRNKAQAPFININAIGERSGSADSVAALRAGFFARGSHEIVSASDCPLQPAAVFDIVNFVKEAAPRLGIRAYDEDSGRGSLRHLYVRIVAGGDEAMVGFVVNPADTRIDAYKTLSGYLVAAFPFLRGVLMNENQARTNVIFGRRWLTLAGRNYVTEVFSDGTRFRLTEGAFFQVNTPLAESLYRHAAAALSSSPKLLDLYGGVGGFALAAARLPGVREIISVEESETAVNDALVNARLNLAENITFYALAVEKFLSRAPRAARGASVIADPPRSGLSREALDGIVALSAPEIVYVSCDPATFARDAGILSAKGYALSSLRMFDMFPQTHHVETAATFRLKSRHF
ncbi:MAG: 23S rRNA (uracil(1939)-C(5))-methyltransferase RlmD [Endomicrobiia bacterium]|nr:23S rRNA (uracil(1939)-C(5))-methyltransferase RlmD [Endomicrobiia bacterium]